MGFKSLANILAETSIAITISIPLFDFIFLLTETFLGLANAMIIAINATIRKRYKIGFNFDKIESGLKPFKLGIVKFAASFLRIIKYQTATSGIIMSSHKNPRLLNSKLFQFIIFFNNWFRF